MAERLLVPLIFLAFALGVLYGGWGTREERAQLRRERDRLRRTLEQERASRDALWERHEALMREVGHG